MNRIIIFFVALQFLSVCGFGQEQKFTRKYSSTVKYQKTEQPATVFEFNYPASEVEDGLMEFFMNQGSKPKESKGFFYVSGVKVSKEDNRFYDVYYKVEKDGKAASKVYAIVTDLGENPLTRSSSHNALVATGAGAGIVAAVGPAMDDHDYKVQLAKQEEDIRKAEKDMNDLLDEGKKLEKKRVELDKQIETNKLDQEKLQTQIDTKKQVYQQFVEKKKN
jgi:hypothetical protein